MDHQTDKSYLYIETDSALEGLVVRAKKAERIALDIEADSLHHYFEKVCLIQVSFGGQNYIIDPLVGVDLSEFLSVLGDKFLILHDAGYDLRMLRSSYGFGPGKEVFDTMLAAQLLGYERFGLTAMIEQVFGVCLTKKGQKSDWSRRPLAPRLLEYACDDTYYLERLAEELGDKLRKLGRCDWHGQSCRRMIEATAQDKPSNSDDQWRIKGSQLLERWQLAFLRQLWQWREKQARKADIPSFKIMGNQLLLELAVLAAGHGETLPAKWVKLPRQCRNHRLESLNEAIQKARSTPESGWPERYKRRHSSRPNPVSKILLDALRAECSNLAEKLGIKAALIAPRAAMEAIAYRRPETVDEIMESGPLIRWQANLLEPGIRRVFEEFS